MMPLNRLKREIEGDPPAGQRQAIILMRFMLLLIASYALVMLPLLAAALVWFAILPR